MKKQRVFQNVRKKRTEPGFSAKNLGTVLFLLLFLPYSITLCLGTEPSEKLQPEVRAQLEESHFRVLNRTALGEESIPLELYIADVLARTMEPESPIEALKAQAVLLRTNLFRDTGEVARMADEEYGKKQASKACLLAAAETKGVCMEYEGKPAYGAYCRVSGGRTRTASEFLPEEYPYLTGVSCDRDFLAEEYASVFSFSQEEFEAIWAGITAAGEGQGEGEEESSAELTFSRDSAGYVTLAGYRGKWVTGESFRYAFCFPSANFSVEEKDGGYVFTVKGVGHGLGMSQFAACEMAKEGDSYVDILLYFFKDVNLTKIE